MKASEVLRRYAAGERDFRQTNLRGQSFRGRDLSDADFSEADIRSANFTNAILKGVNFTGVQAGIQKRWVLALLVFLVTSAVLAGFLQKHFGAYFTSYLEEDYILKTYGFSLGITAIVTSLIFVGVFAWAGQELVREGAIKADWKSIAIFIVGGATISTLSSTIFVGFVFGVTAAVAATGVEAGSIIVAASAAITGVIIGVVTIAAAVASAGVAIGGVISLIIFGVANSASQTTGTSNFVSFAGTLLIIYISWLTFEKEERFPSIYRAGINLAACAGTKFCGTNLVNANFTRATLKSTNFNHSEQQTLLELAYWKDAQKLDRARLGNTYLANPKIRQLVVTLNGQDQNYDSLNLEGVNLQGANLQDTSFVGANLNHARLQDADLSRAILKQTQLDETDLAGATLTGAYIEDWGLTGTTKLNGVQCDYIFMRVPTTENPVPLRKPDNQREMFADGEFADFIQPYVDTLDLYHSQDVDPRAISIALKQLSQNHPDADLKIVAMEKRGQSSLNLKVQTAPTADKSELSAGYFADYNQLKTLSEVQLLLLTEKDDRIRSLEQMIHTALHQPTFSIKTVQGDFMPENSGININAGESIGDISGLVGRNVSGVVNLGTISGTVTNAINQLPESYDPDQPNLKQLLIQLKDAIEADPDLPDTDKADLLEQVQILAEAKQTEEPAKQEGLARKAKKMFEATLKSLPDTAKIVESCSKLLPLILKALGLPV